MSGPTDILRRCNIRSDNGGVFIDLKAGGGGDPPIIAYDNKTWETNKNQIWEIMSCPNKSNKVVIRSTVNGEYLFASGAGNNITHTDDWASDGAQWTIEGGDPRTVGNDTSVKIRSATDRHNVLDVAGGQGNGTPIILYKENGGQNQSWRLWRRDL